MDKLIVANWKMFLTHNESIDWLNTHLKEIDSTLQKSSNNLVLCPSYTVLGAEKKQVSNRISWGAQDCAFDDQGAYTGDISPLSLKQLGCTYVIVGHSERRLHYGETDERLALKIQLLFSSGITPILCIGENRTERRTQLTEAVLEKQLINVIPLLSLEPSKKLIVAYEPVWAIGTGEFPTEHEVEDAFAIIRKTLGKATINICYGGSVDDEIASRFGPLVDGFLVGKASINPSLLTKIITSC